MKIEVVEGTTGLLLVQVLGKDRLACEAAYNRFLVDHGLKYWNLIVRTNLLDQSLIAQSVSPDGHASEEIVLSQPLDIRQRLSDFLQQELEHWSVRSSAAHTAHSNRLL